MSTQLSLVDYDDDLLPYGERPWGIGEMVSLADLTTASGAVDALFAAYKKANVSGTSLRDDLAQFISVASNAKQDVKWALEYEIGIKSDGGKRAELQSSAAVPGWLLNQIASIIKNIAAVSDGNAAGTEMIAKELLKRVPSLLAARPAAPAASIATPQPSLPSMTTPSGGRTRTTAQGPTASDGFPWEWVAGIGAAGVVLALLLWPTEGNIRRVPAPAMQGFGSVRRYRRRPAKRRRAKKSSCGCGG
jgi:hypothetical protein